MTREMEALLRMGLGLLLFRLGGQQSFTTQEITDIQATVAGIQLYADDDGTLHLRTRSPEASQAARDQGRIL